MSVGTAKQQGTLITHFTMTMRLHAGHDRGWAAVQLLLSLVCGIAAAVAGASGSYKVGGNFLVAGLLYS